MGSTLSLFGIGSFGSSLSVLDLVHLGSSLSLRSFSRLGSSLSVMDFAHLGSSMSIRGMWKISEAWQAGGTPRRRTHSGYGRTLSLSGSLHFNTYKHYITHTSSQMKAYGNGAGSISWLNTGGTLHGTWASDGAISVSDRSLKQNIRNLEELVPSSDILRELRPVSYKYKGTTEEKNRTRFGFIAQEIEEQLPQITRQLPDYEDHHGLVYQDLLAFLTTMLQSLAKDMAVLTPRLASVEERISQRRKWKRAQRRKKAAAKGGTDKGTVPSVPMRQKSFVV